MGSNFCFVKQSNTDMLLKEDNMTISALIVAVKPCLKQRLC